jgi:hypothetical protein
VDLTGRRSSDRPAVAGACVLLCSRGVDAEFDWLQAMLTAVGVPVLRLDADALTDRHVSVTPTGDLRVNGDPVRPTVSWVRRFTPAAMPTPRTAADVLWRDSWTALVAQVAAQARYVLPGPGIGLLRQLADAADTGFRTPATIVTTDPAAAAVDLPGDRVVVKVLDTHFVEPTAGTAYGIFPEILDRDALRTAPMWSNVPLVVQEYVPHDHEYRVYFVGGELITFEVIKPTPAALWRDEASVRVRPATLPDGAATRVRTLAARWSLHYGAFDLLVAGADAIFLEVNLGGDWVWFERRPGTRSVGRAVARMVKDLYRGGGSVDLLAFLATG